MNELKLKVLSNGTPEGTYILDQEGKVLNGVVNVTWDMDNFGNPTLVLTLVGVPVEINYQPEEIERTSWLTADIEQIS